MEKQRKPIAPLMPSRNETADIIIPPTLDLVVFSQIRWDFVWQRPQHLMSRWAKERRVYYVEEPIRDAHGKPYIDVNFHDRRTRIVVPHIFENTDDWVITQRKLIDMLLRLESINQYILWFLTPIAVPFTRHLDPVLTVYDCMDELSAFAGAPSFLKDYESELLQRADIVFTGGVSLYEAKQHTHNNIYPFPSSIDYKHFHQARLITTDPEDQKMLPRPRIGFFGVVDERMNIELVRTIAELRPDWQFVMIGPVVKIDPAHLPRLDNIHYLGGKSYEELPQYLSGWDVAILPFALNESTRYISPTKTPEYLAAGKPVVSTSVHDVVRPYGNLGLVHIADSANDFVNAIEKALVQGTDQRWLSRVDSHLKGNSWDQTWGRMRRLVASTLSEKQRTGRSAKTSGVSPIAEATTS